MPGDGRRCGRYTRPRLWIERGSFALVRCRWHPIPVGVSLLVNLPVKKGLLQKELWKNEPLRGAHEHTEADWLR